MRAARAARLFVLFRLIASLYFGVAVSVVFALTHYCFDGQAWGIICDVYHAALVRSRSPLWLGLLAPVSFFRQL